MRYLKLIPGKLGILIMEGRLGRSQYVCLKAVTLKAVMSEAHVIMDFRGVDHIDAECIRLLCDAHRTSMVMRHDFSVLGLRRTAYEHAFAESPHVRTSRCIRPRSLRCYLFGMQDDADPTSISAERSYIQLASMKLQDLKSPLPVPV